MLTGLSRHCVAPKTEKKMNLPSTFSSPSPGEWNTVAKRQFAPIFSSKPKTMKKALLHKPSGWQQWDPTTSSIAWLIPQKRNKWGWNLLHATFFFHPKSCPLLL